MSVGHDEGGRPHGRRTCRRRRSRPISVEVLEERILPAVTLLIDYSLDNGFFASAERRTAIETVASEIGARLNDTLTAVPTGSYAVTDPKTFTTTTRTFSVPANAIRIYVAGSSFGGNIVGQGGWRTNTGIRNFNSATDFQPYVGYMGFDNDGSTAWSFGETGPNVNFRIVARHELLHVLGIGGAATWDAQISSGVFTGPKTRAANGGAFPPVDASHGHFAAGVNSIVTPIVGSITMPTAIDWAALDDIGWDVVVPPTPGAYADVIGRTAAGTWYLAMNVNGSLSGLTVMTGWNEAANWQDVSTGDFDGNGLTDVVGRTAGGAWWVGLNRGGSFESRLFGVWNHTFAWRDVEVGDFNGDGLDDIVGRTRFGSWYVATSTGTSFVTDGWAGWNEAAQWRDAGVGDFNGDGRDDVVARTASGVWYVGLSTGSGFSTVAWAGWNEAAVWRGTVFGDFNGDGRDDIASRTYYGIWYVALSTGTGFSTTAWAGWSEPAGWRDVRVGDFTGDSRADIIARTSNGAWYVGTSLGTRFATAFYGAWSEPAGWRDLLVGQLSGSGKADIMARTAGGAWYVGESTGSGLAFRLAGLWNESLGWRSVFADRNFVVAAAGSASSAFSGEVATNESVRTAFQPPAAIKKSEEVVAVKAPVTPISSAERAAKSQQFLAAATWKDEPDAAATIDLPADERNRSVATLHEDLYGLLDGAFADAELLDALTVA